MADPLDEALVHRLREQALDPALRSGTGAVTARAVSLGTALEGARTPPGDRSPEFRRELEEYLGGVSSPLAALMGKVAGGDARGGQDLLGALGSLLGGQTFAMGGQTVTTAAPARAQPREPATAAQVAEAEAALGFALPAELRQYYLEVADGGVGPGDGVYRLAELVAQHHELTREPVGPQGQLWPTHLLPVQGEQWDLVALDRGTGRLVHWDLEELDDDEELPADQPTWAASFVPEAESLGAWLAAWAR